MIYIQLFVSFLKIGLFSVGGGYAAIPLIQSEIVNGHQTALWGELPVSLSSVDWINALLFLGAFFILRKWKWNPILVMCLCGAGGLISFLAGKFF